MALSFADFESLFALVIVILVASLVYLFRPGMPESMLHYPSSKKTILIKSGKKEHQKRKKKTKKRTEKIPDEPDDSISECSNTSTVNSSQALTPSSVKLPNSSSETQPFPLASDNVSIIPVPHMLQESTTAVETRDDDIDVPVDVNLELNLQPEESLYPTTESIEAESEQSTPHLSSLSADWLNSDGDLMKLDVLDTPKTCVEILQASKIFTKRAQKKGDKRHYNNHSKHLAGYKMNFASVDAFTKPPPTDKLLTNLSAFTEMQTKVKYLEKLLKQNKSDLEMSRQDVARTKSDNAQLRSENEKTSRDLQLLEVKVAELTEQNSDLTGDKNFLDSKLKSLDSSYLQLRCQLNSSNMEKAMSDKQVIELRQHLANVMSANRAQASNSKELIYVQEVASVMSENQILKARYERILLEVQQLRKASTLQLAEVQSIRNSRDVLATNQVIWEEERKETLNKLHKLTVHNSAVELKLQQCTNELDLATKQVQELASALATLQTEAAHRMDQDQLQAKAISSLTFQFEDLNSEKQCLSDAMLAAEASANQTIGELRARVARLKFELTEAKVTSNAHAKLADRLAAMLEAVNGSRPLPTFDDGEPVVSSSTMPISPTKEVSSGDSNRPTATQEAESLLAVREAQDSRDENILMDNGSSPAGLQRCVEKEKQQWQNMPTSSEPENNHFKKELVLLTLNPELDGVELQEDASSSILISN